MKVTKNKLRKICFEIIEGSSLGYINIHHYWNIFLNLAILISVFSIILETVSEYYIKYEPVFLFIEKTTICIFTIEYFARLWIAVESHQAKGMGHWQARLRYSLTPMMLIDLVVILPFYISLFLGFPIFRYDLGVLRMVRLIRIFKFTRHSTAIQSIFLVIQKERKVIFAGLLLLLILLVLSSSLIYIFENKLQPEVFSSIPAAMWWAIVTITTVGYGDVVPITTAGRILGGFVMLSGIGMIALWTGIFASSFLEELEKRNFHIDAETILRVPAFAGSTVAEINHLMDVLRPIQVKARYMVIRAGEASDKLYFIISGSVEILQNPPILLSEGDVFGEAGILNHMRRNATVIALEDTRLLILTRADFINIMDTHLDFRTHIEEISLKRHHFD